MAVACTGGCRNSLRMEAPWYFSGLAATDESAVRCAVFNGKIEGEPAIRVSLLIKLDTRKNLVLNVELCFTGCMDVRS